MHIKSGLKAGKAEPMGQQAILGVEGEKHYPVPPPPPPPYPPHPVYTYTCDHCFGTADRRGNLSNATCNSCW